ncbi:MAG: hypothetical protein HOL32_04895 [Octadecabacter sp.]|jgi:hypothetical protein|nr:hypothetical protein [Octadecabacter sp.]MDB0061839.1 hypothetical protein [Octadecabacter sp.]MDC1230984.1 hypothetical protein [Octadecabacter sp.]MDC1398425.1 hypothetical protein [Octadecabacter sp.]MDC1500364.1 hypothetical protein [Octadecabacter sp.]
MTTLDDRLLAAHANDDRAALVALYKQAADAADTTDAACFFLTHAYVFALELGHQDVPSLHARLLEHGRV